MTHHATFLPPDDLSRTHMSHRPLCRAIPHRQAKLRIKSDNNSLYNTKFPILHTFHLPLVPSHVSISLFYTHFRALSQT